MSNLRTNDVERLAAAFAALSNPQRLRMFVRLASSCGASPSPKEGPGHPAGFCCATEVGAGLDLAPSTVSHHLRELRQAGLVHVERRGRRIDCWASQETLELLASFFAEWGSSKRQKPRRDVRGAASRRSEGVR
jgi:ArsR family transcriptional regulator